MREKSSTDCISTSATRDRSGRVRGVKECILSGHPGVSKEFLVIPLATSFSTLEALIGVHKLN